MSRPVLAVAFGLVAVMTALLVRCETDHHHSDTSCRPVI